MYWRRWPEVDQTSRIFNKWQEPTFTDVIQANAGDCYVVAAIASLAKYPNRIKNLFVTKEKNDAGIHAVKLYIRGKPWVVSIDDYILYRNMSDGTSLSVFAHEPYWSKVMWAAILEKAIAKVKGNYLHA